MPMAATHGQRSTGEPWTDGRGCRSGHFVAGLSGCSSNKSTTSGGESSSTGSTSASTGGGQASGTKVLIDGQDQHVTGSVVYTTAAGNVNIAIGGAATGIAAVLTDANPGGQVGRARQRQRRDAGLHVGHRPGQRLGDQGRQQLQDQRHGDGVDMANPMSRVNKPFEINVTYPSPPTVTMRAQAPAVGGPAIRLAQ